MLLPADVADKLEVPLLQMLAGVAVTGAGAAGNAATETVAVTEPAHPLPFVMVYVIREDPEETPVTTPLEASMMATPGELLLQVPPEVELPRVVVNPAHTDVVPVMADNPGSEFTVSDCCAVFVPPQPPVMV